MLVVAVVGGGDAVGDASIWTVKGRTESLIFIFEKVPYLLARFPTPYSESKVVFHVSNTNKSTQAAIDDIVTFDECRSQRRSFTQLQHTRTRRSSNIKYSKRHSNIARNHGLYSTAS